MTARYLFVHSILFLSMSPFAVAGESEIPIQVVQHALAKAAPMCSRILGTMGIQSNPYKLRILSATKKFHRIASFVSVSSDDVAIVELDSRYPGRCAIRYLPEGEMRIYLRRSSQLSKLGDHGYLIDPDIRFVGWWNSEGGDYLVVELRRGHLTETTYSLLFLRNGILVSEIESGFEWSGPQEDWMDRSKSFYCEPKLSKVGLLSLTCKNHQVAGSLPGVIRKMYFSNYSKLVDHSTVLWLGSKGKLPKKKEQSGPG